MEWAFKLAHPKLLYTAASISWSFILTSLLHVILCFVLLGISASEYLCPNVAKLADFNGHGTGTLMAVLLSWCNSSPDLFSNLMSWTSTGTAASESSNAVALSIGEVLGACGIILCIVEGSVFIIMSSTPLNFTYNQRRNVLRDLAFALAAVLLMWYVCIKNTVTALNCLLMITVYVAYLVAKFAFKLSGDQGGIDEENPFDSPNQPLAADGNSLSNRIKPSLISAMDFSNLLSMLESSKDVSNDDEAELMTLHNENVNLDFVQSNRPYTEPSKGTMPVELPPLPQSSPTVFGPYFDDPEQQHESRLQQPLRAIRRRGKLKKLRNGVLQLFVPHLLNFSQKSVVDAILSIITVPFVIILRLSCPQPTDILDYDEIKGRYSLPTVDIVLLVVQSVICPLISFFTLSCIMGTNLSFLYWILAVFLSTCLLTLTLAFYKTLLSFNKFSLIEPLSELRFESEELSEERRVLERLGNIMIMIYLSVGITNAILWISLIANSLIEMLEIYQNITNISQAILGLTVFAWGNSISDLISNIAMCRLYRKMPQSERENIQSVATKFFMISCTSCLGGVLLNSMGGIGISGLISMIFVHKTSNEWWFLRSVQLYGKDSSSDYKFIVSCIALVLQIFLLAVVFGSPEPIHDWCKNKMKTIGLAMCCLWGVATLCNVLLETLV